MDDTYYMSSGGKIPVKWTAPEVSHCNAWSKMYFPCIFGGTIFPKIL